MINILLLIFSLFTTSVFAQGCGLTNPNCIVPTAPSGTSNNQAASTAFVGNETSSVGPGGRLTLTSGTPVMRANATATSTIYYDCYKGGGYVAVFSGSNDVFLPIASCEISMIMQTSGTGVTNNAGVFDIWAVNVAGTLTLCVATNGSGGGWASDSGGSNTARGTGYSQLDTSTRPYITNKNALAHCYNGSTNEGTVSANHATYLGTLYTTAAGQTGMAFTGTASGGAANVMGLYNAYHQVPIMVQNIDTQAGTPGAGTCTPGNTSWAEMCSGTATGDIITYVDGGADVQVSSEFSMMCNVSFHGAGGGGACNLAVAKDWSSGNPVYEANMGGDVTSSITGDLWWQGYVSQRFAPSAGVHVFTALTVEATSNPTTYYLSGYGVSTINQLEYFNAYMNM